MKQISSRRAGARFAVIIAALVLVCAGCKSPTSSGSGNEGTPVVIIGVTANGSATETTTRLTLTFDQDITGLAAADITLTAGNTGTVKGALTKAAGTGVYELAVSGITAGGQVTVAAAKSGYAFTPASRNVNVYYYAGSAGDTAAAFSSVTANGSATETTTRLTLTFDKDITGLAASDITLTAGTTGTVKGALTKAAGTGVYELAVSGISASGEITVAAAKSGYAFTPASRNVNVFYYAASAITYTVAANGNATTSTTSLTLTFSANPGSLSVGDITISGNASKGSATLSGTGFTRTLSPITVSASGSATVSVSRSGIETGQKTVQVYKAESGDGSSLVAKWYMTEQDANTETGTVMYEFTNNGQVLVGGSNLANNTYTATASTITMKSSGYTTGTASYIVEGNRLTLSNTGTSGLLAGNYYKKGGGSIITYTTSANGGPNTTTTALTLTFSADPGSLLIGDITLGGNASKGSATLTGSGTTRTLSPVTVSATGITTVSIAKTGIESGPKTASVYKEGDAGSNEQNLIAKWYTSQEAADLGTDIPMYEFTAGGQLFVVNVNLGDTYTATDSTITIKVLGYTLGTVSYVIEGTRLTLSNTGSTGLEAGTYYKKGEGSSDTTYTASANGSSSVTTTSLTLTFSADPGSLTMSDITLGGNASKGSATLTGSGTTRTLSPITVSASGNATISISKTGIESGSKTVQVYKKVDESVSFTGITANGSATETTTKLTLTFDKDITGLAASDITLASGSTGTTKGTLNRTGTGVYELTVSGITAGGSVSIAVAKTGYTVSGSPKNVTVNYAVPVSFTGITANGSTTTTTTKLTLTFDKDITGLAASDITLTAGSTGATKGALNKTGTGVYELALSGVSTSGTISVWVAKNGYTISPSSKDVTVHYAKDVTVTINLDMPTEDIGAIARNGNTLNFSIPGSGYSDFRWFLDGAERGETTASITLNAHDLAIGPHRLTVIASKGGAVYSQEISFRVNE